MRRRRDRPSRLDRTFYYDPLAGYLTMAAAQGLSVSDVLAEARRRLYLDLSEASLLSAIETARERAQHRGDEAAVRLLHEVESVLLAE